MRAPTVLITGASGFVGFWAAKELAAKGFCVHGVSRCASASLPEVIAHRMNLHDRGPVASLIKEISPSHLLLCAWSTAHGVFWTDPDNDVWRESSTVIARDFLKGGGERIVLAGSCAEYDWTDPILDSGPVEEGSAGGPPSTPYGRAKRAAADAISDLAREYGAKFSVGRIFFPVGWGESPQRFLPTVVNAVLSGLPARLSSGRQVRDFIDVRDAGAALAALTASDVLGAVNIGSGRGIALADLARYVVGLHDRSDLLHLGSLPSRSGEPQQLVANVRRLEEEVGFVPRYTMDETVASSFDYWKQQRSNIV